MSRPQVGRDIQDHEMSSVDYSTLKLCNGHGNDGASTGNCEFHLLRFPPDGQRKPAACLTEHAGTTRWSKVGWCHQLRNIKLYGNYGTCQGQGGLRYKSQVAWNHSEV